MRQIDADILIPLIQKDKIEGETLDIIKALGDGLQAETLNQACDRHIKIINSLPTIEVEPRKHGYWIWTGSCQVCSVCDEEQYGVDTGRYYCPNCGARMDGMKE